MVAGGITNAIAVRMLFHPRERRFGLQGAIPKNQARLAKSIGRLVGERLLSPVDVSEELRRAHVRETFDDAVATGLTRLLETERGAVREMLPPAALAEVERVMEEVAPVIGGRLVAFLESEDFERRVREFVERTRAEIADRPIGGILTPERQARLAERAERWAAEMAQSEELERAVREYLTQRADEILSSDKPLLEQVPPPVVNALEAAIDSYLPLAVSRLGTFLHHPAARERIRDALHGLFQRFVEDLRFHQRVIARLMVTEQTFDRVIDALERDGVEQLATLLDDPIVRDEIARTIHEAVLTYLRRPVAEMIGGPESARAVELVHATGDGLLKVVRADRTRVFLIQKLREGLEHAEGRTWGQVLAPFDDQTLAQWIVQGARTTRVRELTDDAVRAALRAALDRPIGRPGRWLPADAPARLAAATAPALWEWLEAQLPGFVARLELETVVERKVLGFSTDRVEEIIRGVTQKELDTIVRLGWVLGAFIGLITFTVSALLPRMLA